MTQFKNINNSYGFDLHAWPLSQHYLLMRKKLTSNIFDLIELDRSEKLKITFTSGLVHYLSINGGLRCLLDAVANYKIEREKDFLNLNAGGYFSHNGLDVYFKMLPNEIQLGRFADIQFIRKFADYEFHSIESVKDF
jgi:hypothetical protein